jgi:hypothetical protein
MSAAKNILNILITMYDLFVSNELNITIFHKIINYIASARVAEPRNSSQMATYEVIISGDASGVNEN